MNKFAILSFLFLLVSITNAQTKTIDNKSFTNFNFGRNLHGTGDISGFHYGINYAQYINNEKFYWEIGFESTLNDDESIDYFFQDQQGNQLNGKSRNIIAGFQLIGGFGYHIIKTPHHQFGLSLDPLIRYQSNSIPDVVTTLFPVITDLPVPVQYTEFIEPFRTLAFGGSLRLNYNYKLNNNIMIGFTGAFQTDTNGDSISSILLNIGKCL